MDLIIDSCIYIDWLKKKKNPLRILEPFLMAGHIWTCGIIRIEVLRGIKEETILQQMVEFFDLSPKVEMSQTDWQTASDLAWKLDRSGRVIPSTDIIVAISALKVNATLISTDRHFQHIPGLTCRKTLPSIHGAS